MHKNGDAPVIIGEVNWLTNSLPLERFAFHRNGRIDPRNRGQTDDRAAVLPLQHGRGAKTFAGAVRGHWPIENTLHWSLDVSFGEDQCRVRNGWGCPKER